MGRSGVGIKLAALVLALTAVLWGKSKPMEKNFVFTNVNIIDVRDGSIQPHLTVVIKNGRITGIAPIGLIEESRNTTVVNANGKYLIPGLWDMHVHSAFSDPVWDEKLLYPLYIANGITGIRDMGGVLTMFWISGDNTLSMESARAAHRDGWAVSGRRKV